MSKKKSYSYTQIVPLSEHRPYTQSSSFDNVIFIIVLYCYRHLLEVEKESLFYLYLNITYIRNLHLHSITLFLYCDRIFVRIDSLLVDDNATLCYDPVVDY